MKKLNSNDLQNLIKEHKATAAKINECVSKIEQIHAEKKHLELLREQKDSFVKSSTDLQEKISVLQVEIANLAKEYLCNTQAHELVKKARLVKELKAKTRSLDRTESAAGYVQTALDANSTEISDSSSFLSEEGRNLKSITREYALAVLRYNLIADKLNSFEGVSIEKHPIAGIQCAKSYTLNANYGEDSDELLV